MRHRVANRKLNRSPSHRRALLRNMAQSMIQHGRVRTTLTKAKTLRPVMERLVTLSRQARAGDIGARRRIHRLLSDRSMIPADRQGEYDDLPLAKRAKTLRAATGRRHRTGKPKGKLAFTAETVTHRLIYEVSPRFDERQGGYTRIVKLPSRRVGDAGWEAVLEFVGQEEAPTGLTRGVKTARRRRADARYALAVQLTRGGKSRATDSTAVAEKSVTETHEPPEEEASNEASPDADTDADSGDKKPGS